MLRYFLVWVHIPLLVWTLRNDWQVLEDVQESARMLVPDSIHEASSSSTNKWMQKQNAGVSQQRSQIATYTNPSFGAYPVSSALTSTYTDTNKEFGSPLARFLPQNYEEGHGELFRVWSPPASPATEPAPQGAPTVRESTPLRVFQPSSSSSGSAPAGEASATVLSDEQVPIGKFSIDQKGIIKLPERYIYRPSDAVKAMVERWKRRLSYQSDSSRHIQAFVEPDKEVEPDRFFRRDKRMYILQGDDKHQYLIHRIDPNQLNSEEPRAGSGIMLWNIDHSGRILVSRGGFHMGRKTIDKLVESEQAYRYQFSSSQLFPSPTLPRKQ